MIEDLLDVKLLSHYKLSEAVLDERRGSSASERLNSVGMEGPKMSVSRIPLR